ncbi:MAG: vacuolar iron transporter family protein [Patescibacteria group bacterium]|nr:VIT family protein [Candidatus Saccharibacteria bacterium]MDQ5963251.1 vacuolar iron transporter family protein [Patescibacteria group bacterium]
MADLNPANAVMLNKLRAAVLGANDGIVSTASLIFGVAGATNDSKVILIAGLAGLFAGAFSMGVGEYVSVSTQRDTERAYIEKERQELRDNPKEELVELAGIYEDKGLSPKTAALVAKELTAIDPVKAHLDAELGINEEELTNPVHAAVASLLSFTGGALVPLLSAVLSPDHLRIPITLVAVGVALVFTGYYSATVGGASRRVAVARVVVGGIAAMVITYGIGRLFGVAVG